MSKLFLDDIRKPTDVTHALHNGQWEEFPSLYSWTVVRSYAEFTSFILKNGLPTMISFDHDLSWEHYPKEDLRIDAKIDYSSFKEKTGYDCAKWLTEYCLTNDLELPEYFIHSFNPVGRMNIQQYLKRFQEIRNSFKGSS